MSEEKTLRPWGKERTERLAFRVTKAEREALEELAQEAEKSVSDYIRELIREKAEDKKK